MLIEIIDRAIKTSNFSTTYDKQLSSFCLDVLSGDYASTAELFIPQRQLYESN